mmetsp:Transcript_37187/g.119326  ORF Transcript_37187/g.119326 Transcript_37187/m.119326 type:complete len:257 (+) Transcript_37187:757-1527(+)
MHELRLRRPADLHDERGARTGQGRAAGRRHGGDHRRSHRDLSRRLHSLGPLGRTCHARGPKGRGHDLLQLQGTPRRQRRLPLDERRGDGLAGHLLEQRHALQQLPHEQVPRVPHVLRRRRLRPRKPPNLRKKPQTMRQLPHKRLHRLPRRQGQPRIPEKTLTPHLQAKAAPQKRAGRNQATGRPHGAPHPGRTVILDFFLSFFLHLGASSSTTSTTSSSSTSSWRGGATKRIEEGVARCVVEDGGLESEGVDEVHG